MKINVFKKKEESNDDIKKAFGEEPTRDKKLSRKEAKEEQKKLYEKEQQKQGIIEVLTKVSHKVTNAGFWEEATRIDEMVSNLKSSGVDSNDREITALDGFIKKYCIALVGYCNDKNYAGILSAIREIGTLVSERGNVTHDYYGDKDYIDARIELMKLTVNVKKEQQKIEELRIEREKLLTKAENMSASAKESIAEELNQIHSEHVKLKDNISGWNVKINSLKTLIIKKEGVSVGTISPNTIKEFEKTYEAVQEDDAQTGEMANWDEKLSKPGKNKSRIDLTVSDAPEEEESSIDLTSIPF